MHPKQLDRLVARTAEPGVRFELPDTCLEIHTKLVLVCFT